VAFRLSEKWQAVLFAAILIVAIAVLYRAAVGFQPGAIATRVVGFVKLDIEGNGWSIHYAPIITTNNTAFGLLVEASARLGFSVANQTYQFPEGIFVTAINGTVNGEGGRWWQYWVDGVYAGVAADHQELHDNDIVLWSFSPSMEGM